MEKKNELSAGPTEKVIMSSEERQYRYNFLEHRLRNASEGTHGRGFPLIEKGKTALIGRINASIRQNTDYYKRYLIVSLLTTTIPAAVFVKDFLMSVPASMPVNLFETDIAFAAAGSSVSIFSAAMSARCSIQIRRDNEDLRKVQRL